MNNLKLKPMMIAFLACLVVLVGGGFAYQYVVQQKPMEEQLNQTKLSKVHMLEKQNNVELSMSIESGAELKDVIGEIENIMNVFNKDEKSYQFKLEQDKDSLSRIWEQYLFETADIMANKNYAQLPQLMEKIETEHAIESNTYIDDRYVYITLMQGNERYDQLLPLEDVMMGVWDDAK